MDKSVQITLTIVGGIIVLALLGVYMFNQVIFPFRGQTISVEGNSQIKVSPDVISIYFNVETNGTTAKEANAANSLIVENLITELLKLGFERKDIQTQSLNIYEDFRWENNRQKSYGFKASHQIKIELADNEAGKINDVIDLGVDAGALLQWINFELSPAKQTEYKALALKQAGEDAKTKAQAMAEGLGMKVGGIVSVSTSNWGYNPWNVYSNKAGMAVEDSVSEAKLAATNIQPGDQEVNAYMQVVYRIK